MFKVYISTLVFLFAACSFAQQNQTALTELEVGSKKQDSATYINQTDADLIAHMNKEVAEKCDEHGCTFVSRKDKRKGWTIAFNIGNGSSNTGTSIYLNGNSNSSNDNQNYAGVSVKYENIDCVSDFKIDMDDFINNKVRAVAEREEGSYNMKPLTSDMKFVQLLKLEIYKQLGQSGCLR